MRRLETLINSAPPVRALKEWRNGFLNQAFCAWVTKTQRAQIAALSDACDDVLAVTIAFNTPWAISVLIDCWHRHGLTARLIVADNSSTAASRRAISAICSDRGVGYVALPRNPEWSPNRSHGLAMNWVYRNLIRRLQPVRFGFIDHDCFPTTAYDIAGALSERVVYGCENRSRNRTDAWNLWAGFCFFRFGETADAGLDFLHKPTHDLDTGGRNWSKLYARLSPDDFAFASIRPEPIVLNGRSFKADLIDDCFLHLGGASYRAAYRDLGDTDAVADALREYCGGNGSVPLE